MRPLQLGLAVALLSSAGGCGTHVPTLRNWPNNGTDAENNQMIQEILGSIRCELRNAVTTAVDNDLESARKSGSKPRSAFLDEWGAESLVTLTIKEKSGVNPNVLLMPLSAPSSVFTVGGGLNISSEATRIEKINTFYTVKELYMRRGETCPMDRFKAAGSMLIGNDLQTANLLTIKIDSIALGQAGRFGAGEKNVLSHQVGFQVVATGELTPTWKLVRATINPSGPVLSATRDQTHELLVTFGPLAKKPGGRSLVDIAEQTHFSSQISSSISNGLRSIAP